MQKDLITVIVPVYKAENYIAQCLDSILNQTYQNLEVILIDDGSPDRCPAICDSYAEKDKRVRVIHQENHGQAYARNVGLDNAHGQYIGFIDSDDFIFPQMYQRMHSLAEEFNCEIVVCQTVDIANRDYPDIDNKGKNFKIYEASELLETLYNTTQIYNTAPCNKLYSRSLFEKLRFPNLRMYEDEGIVVPLLLDAKKVLVTDEILYCYYLSPNSVMRKKISVNVLDVIPVYKNRLEIFKNRELQSLELQTEAWLYYHLCNLRYGVKFKKCDCKNKILDTVKTELSKDFHDIDKNPYYGGFIKRKCRYMKTIPLALYSVELIKQIVKKILSSLDIRMNKKK